MARGKLFIIEAGDGSGKETQTRLLTQRLIREGHRVCAVTFPDYAADASMPVRMYLRGDFGTQADEVNPYAASTFFAVDRYASYRMKWGRDYEAGAIVLADRYTTSNMVHQAVKLTDAAERDTFLDWLCDLEFRKMGLPVPDAVFFLDMEPCAAERLIAARAQAKRPLLLHLARIDREAMRIAIVVHAVKIPALIRRIKHGDDESRLNLRADRLLQPQSRKTAMNRLRHPRMTRRLRRLALGEVFGERLLRSIDRLHGRRELHLSRLFKVGVLLVEIAVIRAHGIILRRLDE